MNPNHQPRPNQKRIIKLVAGLMGVMITASCGSSKHVEAEPTPSNTSPTPYTSPTTQFETPTESPSILPSPSPTFIKIAVPMGLSPIETFQDSVNAAGRSIACLISNEVGGSQDYASFHLSADTYDLGVTVNPGMPFAEYSLANYTDGKRADVKLNPGKDAATFVLPVDQGNLPKPQLSWKALSGTASDNLTLAATDDGRVIANDVWSIDSDQTRTWASDVLTTISRAAIQLDQPTCRPQPNW